MSCQLNVLRVSCYYPRYILVVACSLASGVALCSRVFEQRLLRAAVPFTPVCMLRMILAGSLTRAGPEQKCAADIFEQCLLQRAVLFERGVGRALRQPRAVRAGGNPESLITLPLYPLNNPVCSLVVGKPNGRKGTGRGISVMSMGGVTAERRVCDRMQGSTSADDLYVTMQACRMPYGLVVDGQLRELGDVKYLLSPQACPCCMRNAATLCSEKSSVRGD